MEGSNIKEFQCNMEHFRWLRILKLDFCQQFKKTPNFTGSQTLHKVSLICCSSLVKVHPSIGCLERLVELNFFRCKELKVLPSSICKLKSLEVLRLDECEKLRELPIDLGKLEQLRELLANGNAISHIPFSFGCLRNLKTLYLGKSKNCVLSKSKSQLLDNLSSPLFLSRRSRVGVGFFPPSVANLCSLEFLYLNDIYLHEVDLRITLENLTSLVSLDLSGSYCHQSLPFDLCHLSNLKFLSLNNLENLRVLVELPPSLVNLSAGNCVSLENIAVVSNLKRLEVLRIGNCKSLVVLPNMESLSSLVELDISNCISLVELPDMESLSSLEILGIRNCISLVELPNMESLSSLKCLNIRNCNALTIPDNYLHEEDFPIVLRSLSSSLNEIDLMGRYYLQSLLLNLCHHSNLKYLCLDDLQNLRLLPQLPPNLEILSAKNCVSLEKIADLSNLKRLHELDIQNCKSLVELSGLESLESLTVLGIANCIGLRIPSIEKWFKAHSKGDSVDISLCANYGSVLCIFRKPMGDVQLQIMHSVIDPCSEIEGCNGIRLSARIKSSEIEKAKCVSFHPQGDSFLPADFVKDAYNVIRVASDQTCVSCTCLASSAFAANESKNGL
ncbi:disease resistance protein TAO1-like [Ipomoea triloba]|uniref:disease resistance protein TAO1-like n=1 Tax=Ipomoea triloba TaxID=35885 RepID=UPI00125D54CD|nr:disease resistance protein TAO1-like [Ipomoea triloba]